MFSRATKKQTRVRLALQGVSGGGKTFTALTIAQAIGGDSVAVIDTEHGSASKYADLFTFDTVSLSNYSPSDYIRAIDAAAQAGYAVLIIDSLSHAWAGKGGILEIVDNAPSASKFSSGWKDATPQQNRLIEAIIGYPGHVIVTLRTKTEYVIEKNKNGKDVPRKVGLAPVQRDGVEYEFDVVAMMAGGGWLRVMKSRAVGHIAEDEDFGPESSVEFAERLLAWASGGEAVVQAAPPPPAEPSKGELSARFYDIKDAKESAKKAAPKLTVEDARVEVAHFMDQAASDWKEGYPPDDLRANLEALIGGWPEAWQKRARERFEGDLRAWTEAAA